MAKKNNKTNTKKQSSRSKTSADNKAIKDLKLQIDKEKENVDKQIDRYKRLLAEFDNYKRRTDREKSEISSLSMMNFAKDIITVVDDFERTLESIPKIKKEESYIKGVNLIFDKLLKILVDKEIEPFNSIGKKFDPELHEAISRIEDAKSKDGIIVNEYLKGYKNKQKIVRHAQVIVAKNKK